MLLSVGLTLVCCNLDLAPTLSAVYDWDSTSETYTFQWSSPGEAYLTQLRNDYHLNDLVAGATSDTERAEAVCAWVHGLWEHHPSNTPAQSDPIYILQQVAAGQRFRCVEYGIVIAGCLNALSIPSRVLGLKTKDVETRPSGACHVVAEAYLPDLGKWVFIDGQWGVIPFSGGEPLSGLEFMASLANRDPDLYLWKSVQMNQADYYNWISDYLYFYDASFDNRVGDAVVNRDTHKLMLVPVGENNPVIVEQLHYIGDLYTYTHSVHAFYAPPIF
jgi:hypothetical protein